MSVAAASARAALLLSRSRVLSLKCHPSPLSSPSSSRQLPGLSRRVPRPPPGPRPSSPAVSCCVAPGMDGGGGSLADDLVSTAREERRRRREYSALAGVLSRVEPLDASVIGEGVSAAAKDAMKRTISSMLGLLPSDQFHVAVSVSRQPFRRLLVSSVITGYTLWSAEYRLSLMRNFNSSPARRPEAFLAEEHVRCDVEERIDREQYENEVVVPESFGILSPADLGYIRELEAELANTEKELDVQQQENRSMGCSRGDDNGLLEYLRSLEPAMVTEFSQPSSLEVEEIIQQLVQNIHLKCFEADGGGIFKQTDEAKTVIHMNFTPENGDQSDALDTTRDYLAKLLFWCMLLGHHLRGLEYRLHLSFGYI